MEPRTSSPPLIIVGVDGSSSSITALGFARREAEARHARLRAVMAWMHPIADSPFLPGWSPRDEAVFELADVSREVFGDILPPWYEQVVEEGSATRTLIAESTSADLLVVGSRGHGGFAGLLLGSVSSHCIGHAECPVMVVHSEGVDGVRGPHAALVVGHDGSPTADLALEWALRSAESSGAHVEVVRTWSIDRMPAHAAGEPGFVSSLAEVTAWVAQELVDETRSLVHSFPTVVVTLRGALAQPAEELIERSRDARMIVVGTRGHGGFAGLVLGSVSAELAAHAHCAVVVVPPLRVRLLAANH